MSIKYFECRSEQFEPIIEDVAGWLVADGYTTRKFITTGNNIVLHVAKRGAWRNLVGMSSAANITFSHTKSGMSVTVGAAKWVDKAVVGTVSLVFFWPLGVTTGIGVWQQLKLSDDVYKIISRSLPPGSH